MGVGPKPQDDGQLRSAALKSIRRLRGLSTGELAAAMNMPLRTYEHFEAGHGRLNHDYIHRFCAVTDSDPYAVMSAISIASPEFASRAADNKFMNIFTILLKGCDRKMGDRLATVDARTLIAIMGEMFDRIEEAAREREETAAAFLEEGRSDLLAGRPKPGR